MPGSKVSVQLTFKNLPVQTARRLESFIFSLDGQSGRVRIWVAAQLIGSPQPVLGHPVVTEAISMRKQFTTRGWTPNKLVLRVGDWVQRWRAGDGVGGCALRWRWRRLIRIAPMLRQHYPSGTPLVVDRPCGIFRLQDNKQGVFRRVPGVFTDVTLSLIEAFYP